MVRQRVFISSVIDGFRAERAAARAAVESLRHEAIVAETFGAQPYSAQVACLEGVRQSDVYIGVFGERYGHVAASGRSVTEEEFDEARRRGLQILCFVDENGPKEPKQEAFLERLRSYETGYHIGFYTSPEDLKLKIVQGLNDLVAHPGIKLLDAVGAEAHLDRHRWGSIETVGHSDTWFGVVLFPARQGEDYLSLTDLAGDEIRDRFLQPGLFGPHAILDSSLGTEEREGESFLAFDQCDRHGLRWACLEIHTDGTLLLRVKLGRRTRDSFDLADALLIDQAEVEEALGGLLRYGERFYAGLPRGPVVSQLVLGVSLSGVTHRGFGLRPTEPMRSMPIPMHGLQDPLCLPRPPLMLARAALSDGADAVREITLRIGRAFRIAS